MKRMLQANLPSTTRRRIGLSCPTRGGVLVGRNTSNCLRAVSTIDRGFRRDCRQTTAPFLEMTLTRPRFTDLSPRQGDRSNARFFSDVTPGNMQQVRQRTELWLKSPLGDLTPEDWFGMEDDIEFLSKQKTFESVELTFQLLDRLAKEQGVISTLTRAEWVNGELLKKVLQNWFSLFRQKETPPESFASRYGPTVMPDKMDQYCSAFHEARWSSQVAYYIIAGFNSHVKSKPRSFIKQLTTSGLEFGTRILDKIRDEYRKGNQDAEPALELFQAVANACTSRSVPQKERKQAAMQIDSLLLMVAEVTGRPPDAQLFASSINAWALTRSSEGARKSHERLDQMWEARHSQDSVPGWVWVNALRSAINAWAWSYSRDTLRRVQVLLVRSTNFVESGLIPPEESTLPIWNAALQACAVVASPQAAEQAIKIAEVFEQHLEPDRNTYYWYIASLVNGGDVEKGEDFLIDSIKNGVLDAREDLVSTVLHGWARSSHKDKYKRAKRLVQRVEEMGQGRLRLTSATYNALLECCATSINGGPYFANEAVRLLNQMKQLASQKNDASIHPDLRSYTSTVRCLANCGDGQQAEALYEEMFANYKKTGNPTLLPDTVIFNSVLTAYNKSSDDNALQGAKVFFQKTLERHRTGEISEGPDTYSFTTLVSCIARASGEGQIAIDRAKIASNLLKQLQTLYTKEGNSNWQPSTAMYNAVMNCWAKAGCPKECEVTLDRMLYDYSNGNHKAIPDIQSFNILLKALASSNDAGAPDRGDSLLDRINELYEGGILSSGPNDFTYTTLINCYLNCGGPESPQRAESMLREMERQYEKGNLATLPNKRTYDLVRKAKESLLANLQNV